MAIAGEYWSSYEIGEAENINDALHLGNEATSWSGLSEWVWRAVRRTSARGLHSTSSQALFDRNGTWPTNPGELRQVWSAP